MKWTANPSIQSIPTDAGADEIADDYFAWANRMPAVQVRTAGAQVSFHLLGLNAPAIALQQLERTATATVYSVTGGYLVRTLGGGQFEFLRHDGHVQITLRDFAPRLPFFVYIPTHGFAHTVVMESYVRYASVPKQIEATDE